MVKKKEPTNLKLSESKKPLAKNISRTFNTNFSQSQIEGKLLLQLGGVMVINYKFAL